MSNQSENASAFKRYRDELRAMMGEIGQIDEKVLTESVDGVGLPVVKRSTPVKTGNMRTKWNATALQKNVGGIEKALENNVEYASYVNDGHRVVNQHHETVGYVEGQHMLEKAINQTEKAMEYLFNKEVERVQREHDK